MGLTETRQIENLASSRIDFLSHLLWRKIMLDRYSFSNRPTEDRQDCGKCLHKKLIGIDKTACCYTIGWFGNIGKI
jgi:hypothetical protein